MVLAAEAVLALPVQPWAPEALAVAEPQPWAGAAEAAAPAVVVALEAQLPQKHLQPVHRC